MKRKTDETKGQYATEQEDSLNNARAMMGWDEPAAVTIEPPKRTMQRRGRKMVEVEEPAYVKFSTEFKAELAELDAYSLKVFIYIGLSIGYETGAAWPGVRKIAKETGMDKDTVSKAVDDLEQKGFLQVERRDGASNIYRPTCYFAIGEGVPCGRTVDELSDETEKPSDTDAELSDETRKLSDASRVKRAQQDKQESTRGKKKDILDGIIDYHLKPKAIKDAIRDHFKLTPNWDTKFNAQFMQWAVLENVLPEQIKAAAELWRMDKRFNWSVPTLKGIQEHWLELMSGGSKSSYAPPSVTPDEAARLRADMAEHARRVGAR
jgi:hypothetical protein